METIHDPTTERPLASAFQPTRTWLLAFQAQLTEELLVRLRRFARMRALGVANAGHKVDEYYVQELVQDAVGDTFTGVVWWDPECTTLETHLLRAIQYRTRNDREHAVAFPHHALGDDTDQSVLAERDAAELAGPARAAEEQRYAAEVIATIREAATGDAEVLRILKAYEARAVTKADVMAHAKMRASTYYKALKRLNRIVKNLADGKLTVRASA